MDNEEVKIVTEESSNLIIALTFPIKDFSNRKEKRTLFERFMYNNKLVFLAAARVFGYLVLYDAICRR